MISIPYTLNKVWKVLHRTLTKQNQLVFCFPGTVGFKLQCVKEVIYKGT